MEDVSKSEVTPEAALLAAAGEIRSAIENIEHAMHTKFPIAIVATAGVSPPKDMEWFRWNRALMHAYDASHELSLYFYGVRTLGEKGHALLNPVPKAA